MENIIVTKIPPQKTATTIFQKIVWHISLEFQLFLMKCWRK